MKFLRQSVKSYERTVIIRALKSCDWDKSKTAKMLDIGLSTLYRKIKELKIIKGI